MNTDDARDNFMNSKQIQMLWPDSIRAKTEAHFKIQKTINSILSEKLLLNLVPHLHHHIADMEVLNAIFWQLGSDYYHAKKLIYRSDDAKDVKDTGYLFLALEAILNKKYRRAEHFFALAAFENDRRIYQSCRIYLLLRAGDREKALTLSREFLKRVHPPLQNAAKAYLRWVFGIFSRTKR